ncbi:hypothetical protein D3C72_1925690 [compost metagenome]
MSFSDCGFGVTIRSPSAIFSATFAISFRLEVMRLIVSTRSLISSLVFISTFWSRSPIATASATAMILRRPALMPSAIHRAVPAATRVAMTEIEISRVRVVL